MAEKLLFYQRYGVEEYYIYDPDDIELVGLIRSGDWLEPIETMNGWVSPRLRIRFELTENTLEIYRPDGRRFLTPVELDQLWEELDQLREQERQAKELAQAEAEEARQRAEAERQRAEEAVTQLEEQQQRYQVLLEQLRQRGLNPEQL